MQMKGLLLTPDLLKGLEKSMSMHVKTYSRAITGHLGTVVPSDMFCSSACHPSVSQG